jgi:hypothetical protein
MRLAPRDEFLPTGFRRWLGLDGLGFSEWGFGRRGGSDRLARRVLDIRPDNSPMRT